MGGWGWGPAAGLSVRAVSASACPSGLLSRTYRASWDFLQLLCGGLDTYLPRRSSSSSLAAAPAPSARLSWVPDQSTSPPSAMPCLQAQGLTQQFVRLLTEATSEEAAGYFGPTAKYERIQGLCSLAAFHMHQARSERAPAVRTEHLGKATEMLNAARKLDHEEQLPHLGIGQLALAKVRGPFHWGHVTAGRLRTVGVDVVAKIARC